MKNKETITCGKGDEEGIIDDLINFLEKTKEAGATHYNMHWSNDPVWEFKWFETFKILTDEEVKQKEIDKLQGEIEKIKQR